MADPYVGPVAHDSGNDNLPIIRIVVHCTVGADATGAMGTVKYFKSAAATGSAHTVADQDETLVCAYDTVVCWHAPPNRHSLGIEMCCSLSNKGEGHWSRTDHILMMKRTAKWVAEKCFKHGIPPVKLSPAEVKAGKKGVCGHWDVTLAFGQTTHTDPEKYFPWSQFMAWVVDYYNMLKNPTGANGMADWTEAQLRAMMQAENEEYGARLWGAPTGTGTALINTVNGIAQLVLATQNQIKALATQMTNEDVADDAAAQAATDQINKGLEDIKAAQQALADKLASLPKP